MASNSPESPSKKRKQPINGLRRDQSLFAGRRPQRALQQPPDFFTDSLNTSYIPSPSPPKSPTRQDLRARPRQTLGNARSLGAAFKATPRVNDENRPPSSGSSSDRRRAQEKLKPRPAQSTVGAKSPIRNKPERSPARRETPSPARGRQTSITSPSNSESSPGRGYAEAYQRIVEEENLAQEDSVEDMEEYEGSQSDLHGILEDQISPQAQRRQYSHSPMSHKASRKDSPWRIEEKEPVINDETHGDNESDSESGAEYTENITDTSMDSGSSQYAKDLQRLGALKTGTKAFSKARVGEKVGHTLDDLQRRNGSTESLGSSFSAGGLSNRGSDLSVNIPKAWGRKAKPGKDWLARINSRSGRFTGDVPKRHSSGDQMIAENQRREWSEPIDQWIANAADIPLPSSEDKKSSMNDSEGSTPTTAIPRPKSLDRRRQWEIQDDDFTGRSLQISESPPIRVRNATLDRMREREMENLEKRAVTTSRLGELREKSSGESLRRTKSNKSTEDSRKGEPDTTEELETSKRPSSSPQEPAVPQDTHENATPEDSLHDDGEPVPDTPVIIYKNNPRTQVPSDQDDGKRIEEAKQPARRPSHERKDSHDLLRRLARATSDSPSPTREKAETAQSSKQSHQQPDKQVEESPQTAKSAKNLRTPVVTGAWVDQTSEKIPQVSGRNAHLKTPMVTGAWVDTPLPTGGRGPPMPTPSDQEEQKELNVGKVGAADLIHRLSPNNITSRPKLQSKTPLKYSGPPLGKSALEDVLRDARSIKVDKDFDKAKSAPRGSDSEEDPTLHLGESTIQSLEDLIANDEDFSTLLAPTPPSSDPHSSADPSPSSKIETTRTTTTTDDADIAITHHPDPHSYTHLLSRLTSLAPSLRASKKRIENLERAVSTVPSSRQRTTQKQEEEPCNEAGELHDFILPCQRCGCPGSSSPPSQLPALLTLHSYSTPTITTLTIPLPTLWTYSPSHRFPRPTPLLTLLLLLYTCYLIESYARFKYCHPLYAREMVGYGVDLDAPRPPFVSLKVGWRWVRGDAFWRVLRAVVRMVGWCVGLFFGGVGGVGGEGGSGGGSGGGGETVGMGMRGGRGMEVGMMDDEYL